MRIAQIAPLTESVPPQLYGGTERVVAYLTEELVRQGHEVTLFASGDSTTSALLVNCARTALRLDPAVIDSLPHHLVMLDRVRQSAQQFDVLHFHIDLLHCPLQRFFGVPQVTTLHGRLDLPDLQPFYRHFWKSPLVSISNAQRTPMPPMEWLRTIHHGLPPQLYRLQREPGDYLAFLGRISPEKRPDRAIEIATRAGMRLKIAAKIDKVDVDYWREKIAPLVEGNPLVEFVGEIGDADKGAFLGGAAAVLFPVDWPEPFGLVMIEAMACGTPVIAFRSGSVPEVIDHKLTGFIVESIAEAVDAVHRAALLDRSAIRSTFERRFSVERMAGDYIEVYQGLCRGDREPAAAGKVLPVSA